MVKTEIKIDRAGKLDVDMITHLFRDTVQRINSKDYPADQIEDWSSWWTDREKWLKKIEEQYFIKAMIDGKIVGFSSIDPDGYFDFIFTHKDHQRQGVAGQLLKKVEKKAMEQGNTRIYSDVSLTAKGFFEKHDYKVERQQFKRSKDKELINFRMVKTFREL